MMNLFDLFCCVVGFQIAVVSIYLTFAFNEVVFGFLMVYVNVVFCSALVYKLLFDYPPPPPPSQARRGAGARPWYEKTAYPLNRVSGGAVRAETECSICWGRFWWGQPIVVLRCDHAYHPTCIDRWFAIRRRAGEESVCPFYCM